MRIEVHPLPTGEPAGRDLAAELAALHARAFGGAEPGWGEEGIAGLLARPGTILAIAARDGAARAEGFVLMHRVGDDAEVLTLAVLPEARRHGLARGLLAAAAAAARAAGARVLHLEVAAGNRAARALYEVMGLRVTGRRPGYYRRADGTREDALLMSAPLGDRPAPEGVRASGQALAAPRPPR